MFSRQVASWQCHCRVLAVEKGRAHGGRLDSLRLVLCVQQFPLVSSPPFCSLCPNAAALGFYWNFWQGMADVFERQRGLTAPLWDALRYRRLFHRRAAAVADTSGTCPWLQKSNLCCCRC